jgi:hypothetical protein
MKNFTTITIAIAAISIALLSASSCKKDHHDDDHKTTDSSTITITINKPTNMQMFNTGDTVKIAGLIDGEDLHECYISITDNSDDALLFSKTPTVHDLNSYTISEFWKAAVSKHTDATLTIYAENHSGQSVKKTVAIHIMP